MLIKNYDQFKLLEGEAFEDFQDKDTNRIIQILQDRGYIVDKNQAYALWYERSDAWAAGWLDMDGVSDLDVFKDICEFCDTDLPKVTDNRYE